MRRAILGGLLCQGADDGRGEPRGGAGGGVPEGARALDDDEVPHEGALGRDRAVAVHVVLEVDAVGQVHMVAEVVADGAVAAVVLEKIAAANGPGHDQSLKVFDGRSRGESPAKGQIARVPNMARISFHSTKVSTLGCQYDNLKRTTYLVTGGAEIIVESTKNSMPVEIDGVVKSPYAAQLQELFRSEVERSGVSGEELIVQG